MEDLLCAPEDDHNDESDEKQAENDTKDDGCDGTLVERLVWGTDGDDNRLGDNSTDRNGDGVVTKRQVLDFALVRSVSEGDLDASHRLTLASMRSCSIDWFDGDNNLNIIAVGKASTSDIDNVGGLVEADLTDNWDKSTEESQVGWHELTRLQLSVDNHEE